MAEMGIEKEIYTFLDQHHYARHPTNPEACQPTQRGSGSGQRRLLSEEELFEFAFDYELYYSSMNDPQHTQGPLPTMDGGTPLSENDSRSTTETSSIRTPDPVLPNPESPLTEYTSPLPDLYEHEGPAPEGINELKNNNDPFLFPRLDQQPNPPRRPNLLVPISKKRSRSNSPNANKRVVKDIDMTNQVRSIGSCLRCRIQKVTCTPHGACGKCFKAYPKDPESSCIRKDLAGIARDLASKRCRSRFIFSNSAPHTTIVIGLKANM